MPSAIPVREPHPTQNATSKTRLARLSIQVDGELTVRASIRAKPTTSESEPRHLGLAEPLVPRHSDFDRFSERWVDKGEGARRL